MSQPAPDAPSPQLYARRRGSMQELGLLVVIVLLSLFIWTFTDENVNTYFPKTITDASGQLVHLPMLVVHENKFLSTTNVLQILVTQMSWMAIMVLGLTIVIISGGIDISVGSIMGFSALSCAAVLQKLPGDVSPATAIFLGIAVPLGVGTACGLINGLIVVGLRMHPFIVTLATLSIFRWACMQMTPLGALPTQDRSLPAAFTDHFIAWQLNFPKDGGRAVGALQLTPMFIMLLCIAIGWVYLRLTVWGRETYAIGGNEEAARFSGIRVPWVKIRVYVISGLCAGIAGMLTCGFYKSATSQTGYGYELTVVAAAVVGGASLIGGRGTALGALLGMLVMQLIVDGTVVLNPSIVFPPPRLWNFFHMKAAKDAWLSIPVESKDTLLINGLAIIIAVAVDQYSRHIQEKRLKGTRNK